MKNDSALQQCRLLIESSLGWGDAASWTNEDFDTLSESIFDKTGVRLSVSTLKRIWGKVKYDSSPNMGTLNALARYAGFEGCRPLRPAASAPTPPLPAPHPASAPPSPPHPPPPQFTPTPARRRKTT